MLVSSAVMIFQIVTLLLQIQQSRITSGDPERAERLRWPTGAHSWKHDDRHLCGTHQVPSRSKTGTQNSKREREITWGEEGREQGSLANCRLTCHTVLTCNTVTVCNIFLLQHLSDAKKAQQNLEISLKNLESVSHVLLSHHIIVI